MTAAIRENPPDHRGGYELERRELEAEATTYEDGLRSLQERTPEGWSLISVLVDR